MKKVAIIGSVGVPANYGGFETLVENLLGKNCPKGIEYTVFCSSKQLDSSVKEHKGAKLKYIPLKANGAQSVIYDICSLIRCIFGYDVVMVMGVSGCIFLPIFKLLYHKKLIVHIDGLEWKRAKWNKKIQKFLKLSEKIAISCADNIIADNKGISDYVKQEYNKKAELIAYGGEHVKRDYNKEFAETILNKYKLESKNYSLALCRIEPENNCEMIIKAFANTTKQLLFIGNWNKDSYSKRLKNKYKNHNNISLTNAIYDLKTLNVLRNNCGSYIHGHSAGGTNPSLVEAMHSGCNIIAYDVNYNRASTEDKAIFFKDSENLLAILNSTPKTYNNSKDMIEISKRRYTWEYVSKQYNALY